MSGKGGVAWRGKDWRRSSLSATDGVETYVEGVDEAPMNCEDIEVGERDTEDVGGEDWRCSSPSATDGMRSCGDIQVVETHVEGVDNALMNCGYISARERDVEEVDKANCGDIEAGGTQHAKYIILSLEYCDIISQ